MFKNPNRLLALIILGLVPVSFLFAQQQPAERVQPAKIKQAKNESSAFPTKGLMPKEETGALRFLNEHPDNDGRGTVVAIFDTGVDVGAPGLQVTSDGKPKVIDAIDGTGSGDVDTSLIRKVENGKLPGRSGRKLTVSPNWKNPTGEFRVGVKAGFDFFPDELVVRLKEERAHSFQKTHNAAVEKLRRRIADADRKAKSDTSKKSTDKEKALRKDLDEQLKQLIAAGKSSQDLGPLYDCVVWHDGDVWRAAVDTNEDGNLSNESAMTDFRKERQHSTFGSKSLLNFSVNIYDEGDTLSIVADCHPHGTHVAGIVSAYYENQPEFNGVAPGAQIVSVKVGDSRLAGMETGAGLIRGLKAVMRNKCDLINMSFGEPTSTPNKGRIPELFSELVNEHNVIFVASAGNAGPALSTVGAPGGTTTSIIGVGAYISPQMMKAEYAVPDGMTQHLPYTWSSRGPTVDGDWGVDIFAPGGAFAPVPRWTVQPNMRMNGTSMASPNACGNIALMISALKEEGVSYSPHSVRRAIAHSASKVAGLDQFAQGPGLIQINEAYETLKKDAGAERTLIDYEVRVRDRENGRGIYLREAFENSKVNDSTVSVRPKFPEDWDQQYKANFNRRIVLKSNVDWVTTGNNIVLNNGGASFGVKVDPTGLEPGAHAGEVVGLDADAMDAAPLFRVPVTVVRQHDATSEKSLALKSGKEVRRFFAVPDGATWADITLTLAESDEQRTFLVHPVQLYDGKAFSAGDHRDYWSMNPGQRKTQTIAVQGGRTLELVLSQYWSSLGDSKLDFDIKFHGVKSSDEHIHLGSSHPVARIDVSALVGNETVRPSGKFTKVRSAIQPKSSSVRLLDPERDELPDGSTMYEMHIKYEFEQTAKAAGGANRNQSVTIEFPTTDDLLYDAPISHHKWLLYDDTGRAIAADDIWPEAVSIKPGSYKLSVALRHKDPAVLESLKQSPIVIERPTSPISLSFHDDHPSAVLRKSAIRSHTIQQGETKSFFVRAPNGSSVPSWVQAGDILRGTITYGAENAMATGGGQRPSGYTVDYVVTTGRSSKTATTQTKSSLTELKEFSTDGKRSDFDAKFDSLIKDKKGDEKLKVLAAKLQWLDQEDHRKKHLDDVISAADTVIEAVDVDAIIANTGPGTTSSENNKVKTSHEILVDALYRKGRAIGYRELPDVVSEHPIADQAAQDKAFEDAYKALDQWADMKDSKYALLKIRRERRAGRFGAALSELSRLIGSQPDNFWYFKKRRDIYHEAGWDHLHQREANALAIRYPNKADTIAAEK